MTRFFRLLLPAVLATLMLSASADAQAPAGAPCADRAKVVEHLRELYGERSVGQGLAAGGTVIELFVGVGGSFTLFATTPQGLSCLIATGEAWEPSPQPEHFAVR